MLVKKDFFMDVETLGLRENSIILSIACLAVPDEFSFQNGEQSIQELRRMGIKVHIDREEQRKKYGRTFDEGTKEWWLSQEDAVKKEVLMNPRLCGCFYSYTLIREYLETNLFSPTDGDVIWSRGLFDARMWDDLVRCISEENPIPYWAWRDTRTACDILSGNSLGGIESLHGLLQHDPLDDCILDYLRLASLTKKVSE